MEVILLERVPKLGQMGEAVRVKDGFARNFLLPRGKALRATAENRTRFETMKSDLEARSLALKGEASEVAAKIDGKSFTVLRQASETGQLFGSVSPRDLVGLITAAGFNVSRNQIALNTPIKTIGRHVVPLALHPDIETSVTIIVARNNDEAARIERGENMTQVREETEAEAAALAAEAFFEPEAAESLRAGAGRRGCRGRGADRIAVRVTALADHGQRVTLSGKSSVRNVIARHRCVLARCRLRRRGRGGRRRLRVRRLGRSCRIRLGNDSRRLRRRGRLVRNGRRGSRFLLPVPTPGRRFRLMPAGCRTPPWLFRRCRLFVAFDLRRRGCAGFGLGFGFRGLPALRFRGLRLLSGRLGIG